MLKQVISQFQARFPAAEVHAHCDGPCGVYDPSSARVAAEAVVSMTKKLLDLELPAPGDKAAAVAYHNTFARYSAIKEEQAHLAKEELLILWTDYFKPVHLEQFPDLHDTFWKAAKLCSACKVEVSAQHAAELMEAIQKIHGMFWATKNRDVAWFTAS
ncbi:superoxide dismutase, Ni [Phormidium sp. FACHB-1136]|jgi:nickel superoxide dismutase|uniref:superoxide dismutase, Ni n=1 Tax=Phormidium sp. FACHB-1136 TaxID=2692848 RepID=UPI001684B30B|nr:superoxide dismutase, Ni [Phormidium sp. FACHB-1136]MBD2425791.1 superoxide dismutase, Ni [Phormidium sp. FACHB-1136]